MGEESERENYLRSIKDGVSKTEGTIGLLQAKR